VDISQSVKEHFRKRKELSYDKDNEKKETQNNKGEETNRLFLFNLWESYKNPLPSLFAQKG
jgi:hypothetical protein